MLLIFIVMVMITISIIIYGCIPCIKDIKIKMSSGICNRDIFSMNYIYKVNFSSDEFLHRLNTKNAYDLLDFDFDEGAMTITFSEYTTKIPFALSVKQGENCCFVKLNKVTFLHGNSNIPFRINEFMVKKFDAELLPYEKSQSLF